MPEESIILEKSSIIDESGLKYARSRWPAAIAVKYLERVLSPPYTDNSARVLVFLRKSNRRLRVILITEDGYRKMSFTVLSGDRKALVPLIAEAMKHAAPRKDKDEARIRIKRLPLAQLATVPA